MAAAVTLPKLMAAGAQLTTQGKWEDAIAIFQRCLQINPRYIDALYNLGVCYANVSDFKQALQYYQQVLKLNSMDVEATYNCGVAYSQLGNLSEAINAYQRTLEIGERYLAAWVNLANCYRKRGMRQKNIDDLRLAGECLEEAIKRADTPSLKTDLEHQKESLKIFGV